MSSFADTFEMPFARKVGDKTYTVPILTTRPHIAWCGEETARMRQDAHALIPKVMKPVDLLAAKQAAARLVCTMDNLRFLVQQPEGTVRVLEMAGTAAGIRDADELAAFVDGGSTRQNQRDACRASGLFPSSQLLRLFPEEMPTWVDQLLDAAESGDADALAGIARAAVEPAEEPPAAEAEDDGPKAGA